MNEVWRFVTDDVVGIRICGYITRRTVRALAFNANGCRNGPAADVLELAPHNPLAAALLARDVGKLKLSQHCALDPLRDKCLKRRTVKRKRTRAPPQESNHSAWQLARTRIQP